MSNQDDGRLLSDVAQYGDDQSDLTAQTVPDFFDHWWTHHQSLRELILDIASDVRALRDEVAALQMQPQQPQPDGGVGQKLQEQMMALQVDVQNMVDQVARNSSLEESSALALAGLTARATSLDKQIADLTAQIAAGGTLSPADAAALQAASGALVTSAADLQKAVPATTGTTPVVVDPVPPIPPPVVDPNAPGTAGARGGRRY